MDAIDHAFFTENLHLVAPDYVSDSATHDNQRSKISEWLGQTQGSAGAVLQRVAPRQHVCDETLPWFCQEGLPSDHLPLEFAFNFQKPDEEV
jgi:hypothetical protein